jgi:transposase InsO family protein
MLIWQSGRKPTMPTPSINRAISTMPHWLSGGIPSKNATLQWVGWFNNWRLLEPIGHVPPAEYEKAYYDVLERQAIAA